MKRKSLVKSIAISLALSMAMALPVSASANNPTSAIMATRDTTRVSKIILDEKRATITTGSIYWIGYEITPDTATNQDVTYKSSKTSVVTVNDDGKAIAVKPGKATITVTTVDGGKKSTCSLTVKNPDPKQLQIFAMREQEIVAPRGSVLSIDGRIFNLIIEIQIHKLRYEPNYWFKNVVRCSMITAPKGSILTLKAKQFNNIATQILYGSLKDDEAIAQLQALSLAK